VQKVCQNLVSKYSRKCPY